jgi:hypothetical protein
MSFYLPTKGVFMRIKEKLAYGFFVGASAAGIFQSAIAANDLLNASSASEHGITNLADERRENALIRLALHGVEATIPLAGAVYAAEGRRDQKRVGRCIAAGGVMAVTAFMGGIHTSVAIAMHNIEGWSESTVLGLGAIGAVEFGAGLAAAGLHISNSRRTEAATAPQNMAVS